MQDLVAESWTGSNIGHDCCIFTSRMFEMMTSSLFAERGISVSL